MKNIEISELLKHFQTKKNDRSTDWQQVGDLAVEQVCSEYNRLRLNPEAKENEALNDLALCYLAIVDLASAAGNQKAKKRNLDASLWFDKMPRPIWDVASDPSLHSIVLKTVLRKLSKRPWYVDYLAICLHKSSNISEAATLTEAIFLSLGDIESTWKLVLDEANRPRSTGDENWFKYVLDRLLKKVKGSPTYLSQDLAQIIQKLIAESLTPKSSDEIKCLIVEVIYAGMVARPIFFLSNSHLQLLWSCKPSMPIDKNGKVVHKKIFEKLTQIIIDVSRLTEDFSMLQYLLDAWRITAYSFYSSECAATASIATIEKKNLNRLLTTVSNAGGNTDSFEGLISELSACWSARTEECFILSPSLRNMDGILDTALKRYGITKISDAKAAIPYDPIAHYLSDIKMLPSGVRLVQVLKPGYIKYRENGSFKVIKKALVKIEK
jgi:hypothetical protein